MKVFIKGKGETELSQNDFIAQGGEGSVYAKGTTAFKIYTDSGNMIPLGKIQELSQLTHPNIIRPNDVLCDSKNKVVGYTMKYVKDTYALCQLFTKAFRQRNNISPDMTFNLVKKLQDIVKHVHEKNILIVDLNEMNFLCDKRFNDIYAIDVDSYQTPSFHASALMESIRDRHSKPNHFDVGTDWFAFAIVSFQMFIGIHPYKGKHPHLKDIDERMLKNISVFNKDVSVPSVCYDFSVIPKNYINWYKALFDDGKRLSPPTEGEILQVIQKINTIIGTNKFDIKELFDAHEDVMRYFYANGMELCLTNKSTFINKKSATTKLTGAIGITPRLNKLVIAENDHGKLKMFHVISGEEIPCISDADSLMEYENRIYFKDYMNVYEVMFMENDKGVMALPKVVGKVMPNAKLFQGASVQNLMGSFYVSLFPKSGVCYQVKLNDFKGATVIDGKFENNVLMLVAVNKNGTYDKFIYRFNEDYSEFDVRHIKDVDTFGFNFTVLDSGICVHIIAEETLEIFSNKKDSAGLKVIQDPIIKTDMILTKNGTSVVFTKGSKVYSLKMK